MSNAHPPYFANAQVFSVSVDDIDTDIAGRIGLFFPAKADALAALIGAHGQNDPVKLVKRGNAAKTGWRLVAGLHRVEACRILGIPVFAIEVLGDAAVLHGIQASENIDRRELAPLERAMFVAAVADAAKARLIAVHGGLSQLEVARARKAGKVQFTDLEKADDRAALCLDILSTQYSWKAETAEACGLGQKDVQRAIRIFDCLIAPNRDLMDAFKDHPVAQKAGDLLDIVALQDATSGVVS